MMSEKLATLVLRKKYVFWRISVYGVTKKILSRDSRFTFVVMWPKFGNSSISIREVIIISIL